MAAASAPQEMGPQRPDYGSGKPGISPEPCRSPSAPRRWATAAARCRRFHACRQPAFRRGEKMRRPCVECGAFLLCPIVSLSF